MKMVDTKKAALSPGSSDGVRVNRTGRRTYTAGYKLGVVRRCNEAGMSVAAVAMAHGINANLVRRWIVCHQRGRPDSPPKTEGALLPVILEAATSAAKVCADHPVPASTRRHSPEASDIEIALYGARILLRGAVDAQALTRVLDVLSRR